MSTGAILICYKAPFAFTPLINCFGLGLTVRLRQELDVPAHSGEGVWQRPTRPPAAESGAGRAMKGRRKAWRKRAWWRRAWSPWWLLVPDCSSPESGLLPPWCCWRGRGARAGVGWRTSSAWRRAGGGRYSPTAGMGWPGRRDQCPGAP